MNCIKDLKIISDSTLCRFFSSFHEIHNITDLFKSTAAKQRTASVPPAATKTLMHATISSPVSYVTMMDISAHAVTQVNI